MRIVGRGFCLFAKSHRERTTRIGPVCEKLLEKPLVLILSYDTFCNLIGMTHGSREKKKGGAWFPKATVIKGAADSFDPTVKDITILLFYHYMIPQWSELRKEAAKTEIERLGVLLNLGGRLRVSREGINATVTGTHESIIAFTAALIVFDERFSTTDFKYIENMPLDRAFGDLTVLPVKELVYYGIDNEHTLGQGGVHLEPEQYHNKLSQANTVVIDVRNTYESDIGRFEGQASTGGAALVDPGMRKSTDFPGWISKPETREQLKGKQVLMYCTGGVRCERASALLKREYGSDIQEVYQLQGGIEKYLQTYKDGGYWRGKNFVFDKREAFGVEAPEGVGGVLKAPVKKDKDNGKKNKNKKAAGVGKDEIEDDSKVLGRCAWCNSQWDRYIGKRKCVTCEVPVLVCEKCCEKGVGKPPKAPKEGVLASSSSSSASAGPSSGLLRCTLCVKEGCTVAAQALSLTDNGRKVNGGGGEGTSGGKTATTVCKWGGGGGLKKREREEKRRQQGKGGNYNGKEKRSRGEEY